MIKLFRKIKCTPFSRMFQAVPPKDFVSLFSLEAPQTLAFILSFSPKKSYVQKVIDILDFQEAHEKNPLEKTSFAIREYLNQCQNDIFDLTFVQAVEKEVENMIAGYGNFQELRNLRKKLIL